MKNVTYRLPLTLIAGLERARAKRKVRKSALLRGILAAWLKRNPH